MVDELGVSEMVERKLATILSADVAEYSRLMAENEEQTVQTFRGHKAVFESLVASHRGRVFNTAGDAILAEFGSAVEAVRCATEIQAALRTRNDQLAPSRQVRFRIGVNLGDVMLQGSDLLGDGVNVAARIQSAADPGGVCISGSVYDQIRNKLSLSFKPLGKKNYKNIPQPVRTYSIAESSELHASAAAARRRPSWKLIGGIVGLTLLLIGGYWSYSFYRQRQIALAQDGRYGGQVCLGPYREDTARCYAASGIIVRESKISARYPARDPGLSNVISGVVSDKGDVTIEVNIENSSGHRLVSARLSGKLKDGILTAAGDGFRTYKVDWRRE
ncbi:adenylate/guanylate cyclase domain-containing protein [Bradyrhizobium sp. C-145]|uniref:adenylate/guanylate cyclase domain-containing protein n=1 Tax=Bradyrhizobium sp. C-145 TaxID=574727 RepID=UPI00201B4D49|nr:adenylate/guanylate cyclase domain-containing protein [Bradyrhizobium sp. C-145]UQR65433.1 adenylate/guanylate cyclase domain-containing protein [Bradyrhizobium sp. C-145]